MPKINTDQAISSYGFTYNLAQNIPELKSILTQSIGAGWTPEKLDYMIESSPWWKTHSQSVKNLIQMQATDPATYKQTLDHAATLVQLKIDQLGRSVDTATRNALVMQTLTTNGSWDDQVLTNLVANRTSLKPNATGAYTGNAGDLRNHMQKLAADYGVATTDQGLNQQVTRIQAGIDSLTGYENLMRTRAKATYPQLANQIDSGMTVRDIADPYIQTMASTLEIPSTGINVHEPYVQKALAQRNPDGSATSMPMWKFQQTIKADPRYDQTTQAKNDAYAMLDQVKKDWGFA